MNTNDAIKALTAKGRETMTAVGDWDGSFFDGGIAEGEGIWGECFMNEMGQKSTGVINRLRDLGLFTTSLDDESGTWFALTTLGADVALTLAGKANARCSEHPAYDADYCPVCGTATTIGEKPVAAASTTDQPVQADSPAEPATKADKAADAIKEWRGNYNTVFAPAAEQMAEGLEGGEAWTVNVSAMLRQTHVTGTTAQDFATVLVDMEADALAALREWMKTLDRKDASDMEKFNQNRSFLSGYLAAVIQSFTGAKKMPVVPFAKDMKKALHPDALKAGAAARKSA